MMRFLPSSLFGRSLLIMATPLLLTLAITTFVFFDRHWAATTDRLTLSLAGEIDAVADTIERQSNEISAEQKSSFEDSFDFKITYDPWQSYSQAKNKMRGLPGLENSVKDALRLRLQRPFTISPGENENIRIVVGLQKGILIVDVPRKRLFSTTTYIFLLWMIGAAFVLLWIALLFMRNQVRPIKRLAFAAEQFGKGHDVASFKPAGAREVRQASEAFVVMRERIRRQMQQRTEMLAGVSHDLRTPLTRMNLQLAMLPESTEIQTLQRDVQIMRQMIDEYLAFARGVATETATHEDLRQHLQQAADDAAKLGLTVHYTPLAEPLLLKMRPQALQRVFTNILQNAVIYARTALNPVPHVWISVEQFADHIAILFDDNGPGIPAERYDDVFRPFVRLEESRNSETGGIGLGLSIARDIIQSHGGDIRLDVSPHKGLRVEVTLPL